MYCSFSPCSTSDSRINPTKDLEKCFVYVKKVKSKYISTIIPTKFSDTLRIIPITKDFPSSTISVLHKSDKKGTIYKAVLNIKSDSILLMYKGTLYQPVDSKYLRYGEIFTSDVVPKRISISSVDFVIKYETLDSQTVEI